MATQAVRPTIDMLLNAGTNLQNNQYTCLSCTTEKTSAVSYVIIANHGTYRATKHFRTLEERRAYIETNLTDFSFIDFAIVQRT